MEEWQRLELAALDSARSRRALNQAYREKKFVEAAMTAKYGPPVPESHPDWKIEMGISTHCLNPEDEVRRAEMNREFSRELYRELKR